MPGRRSWDSEVGVTTDPVQQVTGFGWKTWVIRIALIGGTLLVIWTLLYFAGSNPKVCRAENCVPKRTLCGPIYDPHSCPSTPSASSRNISKGLESTHAVVN